MDSMDFEAVLRDSDQADGADLAALWGHFRQVAEHDLCRCRSGRASRSG
jgi:hypothetical protein